MTTAEFRREYRRNNIAASYRAYQHILLNACIGLGFIALAVFQIENMQASEWWAVPLTFLYANLAEYLGHRYPMHRPFPGLKLIYQRHAREHHRFFTAEHMAFDQASDVKVVLFPPSLVLFFALVFGVPMWWLVSLLWSDNAAWLFTATGAAYFLNYELLHSIYHLPEDSAIRRLPVIKRLSAWHTEHHRPELMARYHFNISYPIFDFLFGTRVPKR
jgi:hypothetical protein